MYNIKKLNLLTKFYFLFFLTFTSTFAVKLRKHSGPENLVNTRANEDKNYWNAVGQDQLLKNLAVTLNTNVAKNVILFLGDGMSLSTITAARIFKGERDGTDGERGFLSWEDFPHTGLAKTYSVNTQVPDSASTGNAYLTGVKTIYGTIGVDATVIRYNCTSVNEQSITESIGKWAQDAGKRTGFVTSTRVTHATPANLYAHGADRYWECDDDIDDIKLECPDFKDYALQLVEDDPGRNFNVIMGGGYQDLDGTAVDLPGDPVVRGYGCIRKDNRTLWQEWLVSKTDAGKTAQFVRSKSDLDLVDTNNTEFLMGIFGNDHMPYEYIKRDMGLDLPTLADMTQAAVNILDQGSNGYFLLVESGKIDWAHHDNQANIALDETLAMDDAIEKILLMTNPSETLIVVTADHSHTFTISGYPDRGNPISGVAGTMDDGLPLATMGYANGPGYNYTAVNGEVVRPDHNEMDATSWEFVSNSPAPRSSETHGGDDVTVYALGPMSHLFSSVYEQNYIAHAMAYASCVGADLSHCTP